MKKYEIDIVTHITADNFKALYLKTRKPLLLKGGCKNWHAAKKWNEQYFSENFSDVNVSTKSFSKSGIIHENITLGEYSNKLVNYDKNKNGNRPSYCHDIPIFIMEPKLKDDICNFPLDFLPKIYENWWKYCQFFFGPSGSVTPLHFDCLLTHNLFFQIKGTKRFTLIPHSEASACGRNGWRWFELNPENIDNKRFSKYDPANTTVIDVEAGDILFMPTGTLHHVRSLDTSISFNIDFHDRKSAWSGLLGIFKGMPKENVYYNSLILFRLLTGARESFIFKYYKSYLNYVS